MPTHGRHVSHVSDAPTEQMCINDVSATSGRASAAATAT